MYPTGDLTELGQRKAILQARIAIRRWECTEAATQLARPIEYVDRAVTLWRRIAPFAQFLAVPAGILLSRRLARRTGRGSGRRGGKLRSLIALVPLLIRGVKLVAGVRAAYATGRQGQATSNRTPPGTAAP